MSFLIIKSDNSQMLTYQLIRASHLSYAVPFSTHSHAIINTAPFFHLLYHLLTTSIRLNLLLRNLPELIDGRRFPCNHSLRHVRRSAQRILPNNSISSCQRLDLDDTNSRVLWTTVVLAISEIAKPGLECG